MTRPWHLEAKALRASGLKPSAIAARLGKTASTVSWVLDEHGEQQAQRERVNARARRVYQSARLTTGEHLGRTAELPKGLPVQTVTREAISQAVRDFAERKIDRQTLMERITPERRI